MRIASQFLDYLKKNPIGEVLATSGLIFSEYDGVIPDLIFITHEKRDEILNEKDGKFHGAPELVIEILSPGRVNARRDLQIKRELYEFIMCRILGRKAAAKGNRSFQDRTGERDYTENKFLETSFLPKFKLKIKQLFVS
jgi:hypothetical protein